MQENNPLHSTAFSKLWIFELAQEPKRESISESYSNGLYLLCPCRVATSTQCVHSSWSHGSTCRPKVQLLKNLKKRSPPVLFLYFTQLVSCHFFSLYDHLPPSVRSVSRPAWVGTSPGSLAAACQPPHPAARPRTWTLGK